MFGAVDGGLLLDIARSEGFMHQLEFDFPPDFEIDKEMLTSVKIGYRRNNSRYTSTMDHPGFTELRKNLDIGKFIRAQYAWTNGDEVIAPFYLNGKYFDVGEKFPCAAAMPGHLKYKR